MSRLVHNSGQCITATIGFLSKIPVANDEERYAFRYKADVPIALTNMDTEYVDVKLCDLRGLEDKASLATCGFEIRKLRSTMTYEHFSRHDAIKDIYLHEISAQLIADYGAKEIDFARVRVCRTTRSNALSTQY